MYLVHPATQTGHETNVRLIVIESERSLYKASSKLCYGFGVMFKSGRGRMRRLAFCRYQG